MMVGLAVSCTRAPEISPAKSSGTAVTSTQAVVLARHACQGVAEIPSTVDGIVTETNGSFVVTFPQSLPEGTEGGTFYARVVVEMATGKIIDGIEVSE